MSYKLSQEEHELNKTFSNPFICLNKTEEALVINNAKSQIEYEPTLTKEDWIKHNIFIMKVIGQEKWLNLLVNHLVSKNINPQNN